MAEWIKISEGVSFCFIIVRFVSFQCYKPYHYEMSSVNWRLLSPPNYDKQKATITSVWMVCYLAQCEGRSYLQLPKTSINPFNGTYYCSLWQCPCDHCASYTGASEEPHMMHWWFPTTWELGCSWRVLRWTFFSVYCHGSDRHTRKSDAWTERGHQPKKVKGNT